MSKRVVRLGSAAALLGFAPWLSAQNQTFYAGKNATGEFSLYRTVNVMQLAQTLPLALGAFTFEGRQNERLPKIVPRLHPPLGAARV
jgi:hypothetical protein